jgi:hypothetical protein
MKISAVENVRNETKRYRRRRVMKLSVLEKVHIEDERGRRRREMEIQHQMSLIMPYLGY